MMLSCISDHALMLYRVGACHGEAICAQYFQHELVFSLLFSGADVLERERQGRVELSRLHAPVNGLIEMMQRVGVHQMRRDPRAEVAIDNPPRL